MKRDITNELVEAKKSSIAWDNDELSKTLITITEVFKDLQIDWDKDSGEAWVRFIKDNEVLGYIRVNFPLLIINSQLAKGLPKLKEKIKLTVLLVSDFVSENLSMEANTFKEVFEQNKISEAIDLNGFSVNDLWYGTV